MVGDIIKIKAGMYIPVDGILIWGSGVLCNESAITGESVEIKKESHENCKLRKEERDQEKTYYKDKNDNPHDVPSSVILSGT
jgi:P-type E1-E2 ATPase